MRTVYFNGISFESLGLIIRKNPIPPCSQTEYETIAIPDGPTVFADKKTREPIVFSIECTLIEAGMLRSIYAAIQKKGRLILPDEPDKYYNAVLTVETPEPIIMQYGTLVFNATCEPYAYSLNNEMQTYVLSDSGWYKYAEVVNEGTEEAEPVIRVSASYSFDIWVKDVSDQSNVCKFSLDGPDTVIIDVKNEIAYNSAGQIMLNKMQGDFRKLRLSPGSNRISGTSLTDIMVIKNERWF